MISLDDVTKQLEKTKKQLSEAISTLDRNIEKEVPQHRPIRKRTNHRVEDMIFIVEQKSAYDKVKKFSITLERLCKEYNYNATFLLLLNNKSDWHTSLVPLIDEDIKFRITKTPFYNL